MDNLTHGLAGLGIVGIAATTGAVAADPLLHQTVFWSVMVASQLPDLDIIAKFQGPLAYLKKHRGSSHSLISLLTLPSLITMMAFWFTTDIAYHLVWFWSFVGVSFHIFLDLLTSYGTRATWPLSNRAHAWDILMIVEVPLILLGLGATFAWLAFQPHLPSLVAVSWLLGFSYIGAKVFWRHKATQLVDDYVKAHGYIVDTHGSKLSREELGVIPTPWPFSWNFVVKRSDNYLVGSVNIISQDVQLDDTYPTVNMNNQLIRAGSQCSTTETFLAFARYPSAVAKPNHNGYQVVFTDLRFRFRDITPLSAIIQLDKDMTPQTESYTWGNKEGLAENYRALRLARAKR